MGLGFCLCGHKCLFLINTYNIIDMLLFISTLHWNASTQVVKRGCTMLGGVLLVSQHWGLWWSMNPNHPSKLKLSKLSKAHFIVTPKGTQFFNLTLFKNIVFQKIKCNFAYVDIRLFELAFESTYCTVFVINSSQWPLLIILDVLVV